MMMMLWYHKILLSFLLVFIAARPVMATALNPSAFFKSSSDTASPVLKYWHMWTDEHGISHQTHRNFEGFSINKSGNEHEKDQLSQTKDCLNRLPNVWKSKSFSLGSNSKMVCVVCLPGQVNDWHENPAPQWIFVVSGVFYVETMDGVRVEMKAGEVAFGEDQNCVLTDGKLGHLSGAATDEPLILMLIQVGDDSECLPSNMI